ncbi:MAG: hypothetical protein GY801_15490, partial [bacterium]|nr:hypothetical protein [bacterium]
KIRARLQKSVRSTLQEALKRLQHGELKAAHTVASEVFLRAKQDSDKEYARQLLAESTFRLVLKTQDFQEKLSLLNVALDASPQDARLRFQRGIAFLQTDRAAEALQEFDIVTESDPDREGLAFFRQLALSVTGKTSKRAAGLSAAEKNTLTLLERFRQKPSKKAGETPLPKALVGNEPLLWELLVNMRHERSFGPTESFQELVNSVPQGPASAIAQYYQGIAAMREQQDDSAFAHWQAALKQDFGPRWCQKNIALSFRQDLLELVEKNRWHEIVNKVHHLPKSLDDEVLNQIYSLALFHLGYEQAEKNKWPQAIKYWHEASGKANNRYLAQNMALAREKQGEWDLAANAWKDMLRRKPRKTDHPDYLSDKQVSMVWDHISDCYYSAFQDYNALECLQKAVENAPEDLELRFKLVSAFGSSGIGHQDGAIRELQAIIKIDPDNIEALTQLAHHYKKVWRHDPQPLWKKILEREPDNTEARKELAESYVAKAFPPSKGGWFAPKAPSYKKQLAILKEALALLPEHPDILVAFGWAHMDAKKKALAKDAFLDAYQAAPKEPHIAAAVLQNLIHLQETPSIEKLIPEIQQNPILLPMFWIDQGKNALDHPGWPERFFEAALGQVAYSDKRAGTSKASALVDICVALMQEESFQKLQQQYMTRVRQEVPKSGAVEYLQAFTSLDKSGDKGKARRLLRKAKKLASAANETILLQHIQEEERFLSGPRGGGRLGSMFGPGMPPIPKDMQPMLEEMENMMAEVERTQGRKGLEQVMKQMMEEFEEFGGMDDEEFF